MSLGAYSEATEQVEQFLSSVDVIPREELRETLPTCIEYLVATGESARATELAKQFHQVLASSANGATSLDLLGVRQPTLRLPDGSPNFVGVSQRLIRGDVTPSELARLATHPPWACLAHPELYLLLFNALQAVDLGLATRYLNKFWRLHGVPSCRIESSGGGVLGRWKFDPAPSRDGGPLVSVIVAALDAEDTIGYALQSLRNQSYRNIEILVADDGSHDDTLGLARQHRELDRRVRIFASHGTQGPYNLRNHLLSCARGDLITFHDADDLALPTRIEQQVRDIQSHAAIACISDWIRVSPKGRVVFFKDQRALRMSTVSTMVERSIFDRIGPFRSVRFGADFEFVERLKSTYGLAVRRVRHPTIIGLWDTRSLTRAPGGEALETGYRAPARRAYADLVYRALNASSTHNLELEIEDVLRSFGLIIEPQPVAED